MSTPSKGISDHGGVTDSFSLNSVKYMKPERKVIIFQTADFDVFKDHMKNYFSVFLNSVKELKAEGI
jgi:hypothetical protein